MRIWWILSVAVVVHQTYAQVTFGPNGLQIPPINIIAVLNFLRNSWKKLTHLESSREYFNASSKCWKNGSACEEIRSEDMAKIPNNTLNQKILLRLRSKKSDANFFRTKAVKEVEEEEGRFNPMLFPSPGLRSVLWIRFYYVFFFAILIFVIIFWAPYFFTGMILQELKEGSGAEEAGAIAEGDMDMMMANTTSNETMNDEDMEECMEDMDDIEQINGVNLNYSIIQMGQNKINTTTAMYEIQQDKDPGGQEQMNAMHQTSGMNAANDMWRTNGMNQNFSISQMEPHMQHIGMRFLLHPSSGVGSHTQYNNELEPPMQHHEMKPYMQYNNRMKLHVQHNDGRGPYIQHNNDMNLNLIRQHIDIEQLNALKPQHLEGTAALFQGQNKGFNHNVELEPRSRMDHRLPPRQQMHGKLYWNGNKILEHDKDQNNGNEEKHSLKSMNFKDQFEEVKTNEELKQKHVLEIGAGLSPNIESKINKFQFNHGTHKNNTKNEFGQTYNLRRSSNTAQNSYIQLINNIETQTGIEINQIKAMGGMRQMAEQENANDDMEQMNRVQQMDNNKQEKKRNKLKCKEGINTTRYTNNVKQNNGATKLNNNAKVKKQGNGKGTSNHVKPINGMKKNNSSLQKNDIQQPPSYSQINDTSDDANVNDNRNSTINAKEQMHPFQYDDPINEQINYLQIVNPQIGMISLNDTGVTRPTSVYTQNNVPTKHMNEMKLLNDTAPIKVMNKLNANMSLNGTQQPLVYKLSNNIITNVVNGTMNEKRYQSDLISVNVMNHNKHLRPKNGTATTTGKIDKWRNKAQLNDNVYMNLSSNLNVTKITYDSFHGNEMNGTNSQVKKSQLIGAGFIYDWSHMNKILQFSKRKNMTELKTLLT